MNFLEAIKSSTSKRQSNSLLQVLKLIWRHEKISRKDVAAILDYNKSSVSRNVEQLMTLGYIEEGGGFRDGTGRSAVSLKFCDDLFYTVGICYYELASKVVLLNAKSDIVAEEPLYGKLSGSHQETCEYTGGVIHNLLSENGISPEKLAGIGIALPGIIDPANGDVLSSSAFGGEEEFNLCDYFRSRFNCFCTLINVSHLRAMIEKRWGKARGMNDFICIDTGYGAGIYMNGQLCFGHQFHAGELGYMQISSDGPRHTDGRAGTLARIAPAHNITSAISDIIAEGGDTKVKKYLHASSNRVFMPMVVNAIRDGDQLCAQLMADMFEYVGTALVNVAYLLNPETIFLASWTADCPECSLEIVRRKMGHYGVSHWKVKTSIDSAQCNSDDFARGAGLLPIENLFNY